MFGLFHSGSDSLPKTHGGFTSWYFDSPVDSTMKYETYISRDLIAAIDTKYHTIKDKKGRAITGLSMGGHGAFEWKATDYCAQRPGGLVSCREPAPQQFGVSGLVAFLFTDVPIY